VHHDVDMFVRSTSIGPQWLAPILPNCDAIERAT
jgi:hypothetical protein